MNLKLDKGQLEKSGKLALRVGKAVVVEGVKALVLKRAATAITSAFEGKGTAGVNLDTILGEEKEKDASRKWFFKKKKEVVVKDIDVEKNPSDVKESI
jgi:hypothetical protein